MWRVIVALGLAALASGCSYYNAAVQVGGADKATWVFLSSNNPRLLEPGVYRCFEYGARPVCYRADVVEAPRLPDGTRATQPAPTPPAP